jgi:hypothetical protein
MIRRGRIWMLLHPKKRWTVAPMPLPEAIPVAEEEVAAVLAEVRRELESSYPLSMPIFDPISTTATVTNTLHYYYDDEHDDGVEVTAIIMAQVIILD